MRSDSTLNSTAPAINKIACIGVFDLFGVIEAMSGQYVRHKTFVCMIKRVVHHTPANVIIRSSGILIGRRQIIKKPFGVDTLTEPQAELSTDSQSRCFISVIERTQRGPLPERKCSALRTSVVHRLCQHRSRNTQKAQ